MKESSLMRDIQIALAKIGARLFRNNIGMLEDKFGNKVRYGLCTGSSDLIGWQTVIVRADMVGKPVAVFIAVEVKTESGKLRAEQTQFIEAVNKSGGIGFVARSTEEATRTLGDYVK